MNYRRILQRGNIVGLAYLPHGNHSSLKDRLQYISSSLSLSRVEQLVLTLNTAGIAGSLLQIYPYSRKEYGSLLKEYHSYFQNKQRMRLTYPADHLMLHHFAYTYDPAIQQAQRKCQLSVLDHFRSDRVLSFKQISTVLSIDLFNLTHFPELKPYFYGVHSGIPMGLQELEQYVIYSTHFNYLPEHTLVQTVRALEGHLQNKWGVVMRIVNIIHHLYCRANRTTIRFYQQINRLTKMLDRIMEFPLHQGRTLHSILQNGEFLSVYHQHGEEVQAQYIQEDILQNSYGGGQLEMLIMKQKEMVAGRREELKKLRGVTLLTRLCTLNYHLCARFYSAITHKHEYLGFGDNLKQLIYLRSYLNDRIKQEQKDKITEVFSESKTVVDECLKRGKNVPLLSLVHEKFLLRRYSLDAVCQLSSNRFALKDANSVWSMLMNDPNVLQSTIEHGLRQLLKRIVIPKIEIKRDSWDYPYFYDMQVTYTHKIVLISLISSLQASTVLYPPTTQPYVLIRGSLKEYLSLLNRITQQLNL